MRRRDPAADARPARRPPVGAGEEARCTVETETVCPEPPRTRDRRARYRADDECGRCEVRGAARVAAERAGEGAAAPAEPPDLRQVRAPERPPRVVYDRLRDVADPSAALEQPLADDRVVAGIVRRVESDGEGVGPSQHKIRAR